VVSLWIALTCGGLWCVNGRNRSFQSGCSRRGSPRVRVDLASHEATVRGSCRVIHLCAISGLALPWTVTVYV